MVGDDIGEFCVWSILVVTVCTDRMVGDDISEFCVWSRLMVTALIAWLVMILVSFVCGPYLW